MTNQEHKYGLIINLNKYNTYCEIIHKTFICESIEECRNELINFLVSELNVLNIDFPLEFSDFEYIWLKQNYINTNIFNYMIFSNNIWSSPWELDDIYTDVLDKIHDYEIANFNPDEDEPDNDLSDDMA